MKDTDTYEFYPQYCFSASPTYDRWCPLRATDIYALRSHPGFEGTAIRSLDSFRKQTEYLLDTSTRPKHLLSFEPSHQVGQNRRGRGGNR